MQTDDVKAFEDYLRSRGWSEKEIQSYIAEAENKAVKSLTDLDQSRKRQREVR